MVPVWPDLNHDERTVQGKQMDSTWVPYGSRTKRPSDADISKMAFNALPDSGAYTSRDNDYDIIDDENQYLVVCTVRKKPTGLCLSPTPAIPAPLHAESDAMKTRGIAPDKRIHPRGKLSGAAAPIAGVRITACRDNEKAKEYKNRRTNTRDVHLVLGPSIGGERSRLYMGPTCTK